MNRHPYLKAYMAGVLVPTWFLLVILAGFITVHHVWHWPIPVERAIVFPMAIVPNLWGLWNLLYVALRLRRFVPLGVFGALLPLLLMPSGLWLARLLEIPFVTAATGLIVLPVGLVVYYLAWRHAVAFFNDVVGVG